MSTPDRRNPRNHLGYSSTPWLKAPETPFTLLQARQALRLNQQAMAWTLGMCLRTYNALENGPPDAVPLKVRRLVAWMLVNESVEGQTAIEALLRSTLGKTTL